MTIGADQLGGMLAFARVVEERGFSPAARRLGRSKSAVSKEISRLEDRLGVRLLNLTTRRLSLTEAGRAVYERCARMLAEAEEAERIVAALSGAVRGTLRIAAPVSFGVRWLAPLLPPLLRRYPELEVDLSLSDRVVDLVEEGFDLAIRIADLPDSGLVTRRLTVARRALVASPDYLARAGTPTTPADLAGHEVLGYAYLRGGAGQELRFRGDAGPVTARPDGRLHANNGDALLAAAEGGLGIVLLPTFICADALRAGRLRAVLAGVLDMDTAVHAIWPANRNLSPKVRAVVDWLAETCAAAPPWDTGLDLATG